MMKSASTVTAADNHEEAQWKVIESKKKGSMRSAKEAQGAAGTSATDSGKVPSKPNSSNQRERAPFKLNPSTYSKIFQKKEKDTAQVQYEGMFTAKSSSNPVTAKPSPTPLEVKQKPDKTTSVSQPKKKIALFDVLMSTSTNIKSDSAPVKSVVQTHSSTEKFHSNAQRVLETTLKPKNFVVQPEKLEKKKRKKVLSSFKKRILKERMRMHIQQQIIIKLRLEEKRRKREEKSKNKNQQQLSETIQSTVSYPSIRIYNFANDINWQDESEKDKIIANIKEILVMIFENHQHLLSSFIALPPVTSEEFTQPTAFHQISSLSIWKWRQSSNLLPVMTTTELSSFSISFIDITFKHYESAQLYLNLLEGMVIGGDTLHVLYAPLDKGEYVNQQLRDRFPVTAVPLNPSLTAEKRGDNTKGESSTDITSSLEKASVSSFTVILCNIIQDEDELQESEDVQEILEDIFTLCYSITDFDSTATTDEQIMSLSYQPKQLWVEKILTSAERELVSECDILSNENNVCNSWFVKFASWKDAFIVFSSVEQSYRISWYDQERTPLLVSNAKQNHLTISNEDIIEDLDEALFGLGLLSFVSSEEYEDEDERTEIVENIHTIFTSLTALSTEIIDKLKVERIIFVEAADSNNSSYHVYVLLNHLSLSEVLAVYQSLSEITITGQSLTLEVTVIRDRLAVESIHQVVSLTQWRQLSGLLVNKEGEQSLVITDSHLAIINYAHDDMVRLKRQFLQHLQELCGGPLVSITELRLTQITAEKLDPVKIDRKETEEPQSVFQICLQYYQPETAMTAMLYFDGLLLGGSRVRATVTTAYSEEQEASTTQRIFEYQQPEHNPNSQATSSNQSLSRPSTDYLVVDFTHLQNYFECAYFEYFFLPSLPTHSISDIDIAKIEKKETPPRPEKAAKGSKQPSNNKQKNRGKKKSIEEDKGSDEEYEKEIQKDEALLIKSDLDEVLKSQVGVYTTAQSLPKIGFHEEPLDSSIPVASEELNELIKQLLMALSNFQAKAKQDQLATKGKPKLRYHVGMKQVLALVQRTLENPLQQTRCRLIIIAPNTERNEEVDQKLRTIITKAKECDIPIVYALSKRQIGKALQMPIKQTIVGIIDANGVYDIFKKVIACLPTS